MIKINLGIIICTHGKASRELLNSTEMIMGRQNNIRTVNFLQEDGPYELKEKYIEQMGALDYEDGLFILVDLRGGTPFNVATELALVDENIDVISGVNIPMLMEIISVRSQNDRDYTINNLVKASKDSIFLLDKEIKETNYSDL